MPILTPLPPAPSGVGTNLRFYQAGTATANFIDNQWYFGTALLPAYSRGMRITATTAALEISFDGSTVHGKVAIGATADYPNRCEGYIAVRGNTSVFTVEVW